MGLCGVTDVKQVDRSVAQDPGPDGAGGVVGELERLARLLEQGYITRPEFESLKGQPPVVRKAPKVRSGTIKYKGRASRREPSPKLPRRDRDGPPCRAALCPGSTGFGICLFLQTPGASKESLLALKPGSGSNIPEDSRGDRKLVPKVRLELTRDIIPPVFETGASTIPPLRPAEQV